VTIDPLWGIDRKGVGDGYRHIQRYMDWVNVGFYWGGEISDPYEIA